MSLIKNHFNETKRLIKEIDKNKVAAWFLEKGFFPEDYVLPPSFIVKKFELKQKPYIEDFKKKDTYKKNKKKKIPIRKLITISYPKSLLSSRVFGIQHPHNYHDIVYYLINNWDTILEHLFPDNLKIFSYSFPIPVNAKSKKNLSNNRTGRMIYEWIEMAEKDLVVEAHKYNFIIRTDITNFYNSIYTHSISWALHGRDVALKDSSLDLLGNKIDKLIQYANDRKTNGIPVGSALSDIISEIILTKVDKDVSLKLSEIDFIGTRFKDDYRILCNNEDDAKKILKILSDTLIEYNLTINEHKTKILPLPDGLYRQHIREYYYHSFKEKKEISFKDFEMSLLKTLEIHRSFPGTSIIEKFLSELFTKEKKLEIKLSKYNKTRKKQILKIMSLLILLKRESEKSLCYVLAILDYIYNKYILELNLKNEFKDLIKTEIKKANDKKSVFELVWLVFFWKYLRLGNINLDFVDEELKQNEFLKSVIKSKQNFFKESNIELFIKPKDCEKHSLFERLFIFENNLDKKNNF
jgi:hypothetical protein